MATSGTYKDPYEAARNFFAKRSTENPVTSNALQAGEPQTPQNGGALTGAPPTEKPPVEDESFREKPPVEGDSFRENPAAEGRENSAAEGASFREGRAQPQSAYAQQSGISSNSPLAAPSDPTNLETVQNYFNDLLKDQEGTWNQRMGSAARRANIMGNRMGFSVGGGGQASLAGAAIGDAALRFGDMQRQTKLQQIDTLINQGNQNRAFGEDVRRFDVGQGNWQKTFDQGQSNWDKQFAAQQDQFTKTFEEQQRQFGITSQADADRFEASKSAEEKRFEYQQERDLINDNKDAYQQYLAYVQSLPPDMEDWQIPKFSQWFKDFRTVTGGSGGGGGDEDTTTPEAPVDKLETVGSGIVYTSPDGNTNRMSTAKANEGMNWAHNSLNFTETPEVKDALIKLFFKEGTKLPPERIEQYLRDMGVEVSRRETSAAEENFANSALGKVTGYTTVADDKKVAQGARDSFFRGRTKPRTGNHSRRGKRK